MATTAVFDEYQCDIYQPEDDDLIQSTHDHEAIFSLHLFSATPNIMNKNLIVLQQDLLGGCAYWSANLSRCLSALNVAFHAHPSIIYKITSYAYSAANEYHNMGSGIIPLVVIIKAANVSYDINEEAAAIDEAVTRSINTQVLKLAPASKSSIQALEKIKVEGCSQQYCVICLEVMKEGSKAARMPCSHIYHQDCLVNWLKNSSLCPLCRFQLS